MKLRNKILIALSLAWLIFLGLTYVGSKYFLLRSFLQLEHTRADQDLGRVDQALDQINYALYTYTSDWSHWNDLYDFMQGKQPEFVPANLNMTAFVNSHVNLISYWDKEGKLVVGTSIDTDNQKFIPFPPGLEDYIYPKSLLLDRSNPDKDLRGYVLTSRGILLVAASAVTDGDKLLPPLGASIFGRDLDQNLVDKISETTKVKLKLFLRDEINKSEKLQSIFKSISGEKPHFSEPIENNLLQGYTLIKDINEKPIGMFRMETQRGIYNTGLQAINYYLASFIALGILFSLLMLWLLRVLIIKRLEKLDNKVAYISSKKAIKERVEVTGSDELSSVSTKINQMLDTIQTSQELLENRVEERTQELQKTNVHLQQEISERKSVERELIIHKEHLVRLAHYDNLTALPNRVFFNEILNKSLEHAKRNHLHLAVLFVDLDRFKNINDALGHPVGDLVLKEMGERFAKIIRAEDIIARLGGDEFIIMLNNINDAKYAGPVAEKILHAATLPVKVESHEFFITASIGISIYPTDGESLESLQKNADMAMYKAKRDGGGIYHYYTPEMDSAANEHMKLEAALRKGIQNEEFVLYFQPQLDLRDGKIKRVEALIRWESPELGFVNPGNFIPLAEETGLIIPIGEWALQEACRIAKSWQDEGYEGIAVAVNISPKQFKHQDLAMLVKQSLYQTKLDSKYLEVEITETAVMDNVDDAISKLQQIRELGVHISVDDFGTGYTSINYLKQFPINILKIDQTFIKGIPHNENDISITTAVTALGHKLGFEIVAEGVETVEQLEFLTENGVDYIQGYYLSRPLPATKIIEQFVKKESESSVNQ